MNEITMGGAFRLATAILLSNYDEYVKALKTIMKTESYCKKLEPIVREWDKWDILNSEVTIIKSLIKQRKDNNVHPHELEKIKELESMKKPKKPTDKQIEKLNAYYDALHDKVMCEQFYKSKRYQILTLGKGIPGEELIIKIQKEVGYK